MIKIKMNNGDEFRKNTTREKFIENELHCVYRGFSIQCRGFHAINTVKGDVTINIDQISSIEDIK